MGLFGRQLLRLVLAAVTWPRLTLLLALALLAASVWFSLSRLTISADQNKLFDPRVPFFRDYLAFIEAFPENEAVYVVARPRDPAASVPVKRWTSFADDVIATLRPMRDRVRSVDGRVKANAVGAQGLLFDEPYRVRESFEGIRQFLPLVKIVGERGGMKALVLGDTPLERLLASLERAPIDADTAKLAGAIGDSLARAIRRDGALSPGDGLPDLAALDDADPSRLGYYYVPDQLDPKQNLLLVRVYPKTDHDSLTAIAETIEAIQSRVDNVAKDYPEFTVGLTGRPVLDAVEMRTTDRDTHRAEILALSAVFVGLVVALRSIWLAIAGELALGVGIGWTFGWATLSVGQLNLLSIVFLLALIGIGMDYLVQILVRYRLEASRRRDPRRVWIAVFRHVASPINTACLGAAGAFLVSRLTEFKGAADLGTIAGGGLVLCLIAGYVVLPPLLTLFPIRPKRAAPLRDAPTHRTRAAWPRLLLPLAWVAAIVAGRSLLTRTTFDPDLIGLQAPGNESVALVRHLQTWSAVVISPDLETLRRVRGALDWSPLVASTESLLDADDNLEFLRAHRGDLPRVEWATPYPVDRGAIDSIAKKSRALADKVAARGAAAGLRAVANTLASASRAERDWLAGRLQRWQLGVHAMLRESLESFTDPKLDVATLPQEMRSHYASADGRFALYVYPKADLWDQRNLEEFVADVESRIAAVPGAPAPTGIAINLARSTKSIEQSFHRATAYALGLILLLVLLDLKSIGLTLLAVSVLALGLPMLVIAMALLGADWNFANFFALPILIGAGHEYGVFLVHRYLEARDFPKRRWRSWDASDKALALCAFVTCSSFGFFWLMASHRGLKSLGLVMAVGTACIYLASVVALRPVLKWRLARRLPRRRRAR